MEEDISILAIKDYGHIKFTLNELLDARKMTRNQLARLVNTRFEVIDRLYQGDVEKIDTDILARICFVLKCKTSDIFEHVEQ